MAKDKYFWLLILIVCGYLFPFLGATDFNTKGASREAIVALSMLNQNNWILPINNGVDIAYKPPFYHWCVALISTLTGGVTEYASRIPSAIALAIMTLAGYVFFARRTSAEVAFIMALVTLTNFEVHRSGTGCRVDMMLSAFMVVASYQLYQWGEKRLQGIPYMAILCLSGAVLTKGPVGMVLPCLVTVVFLWIRSEIKLPQIICSFLWVALASSLLPLISWYWAAYQQGGDAFLQLVLEENVWRFLGKMTYESHENPVYYNVITILAGYMPYTLLVVISLFVWKHRETFFRKRSWWSCLRENLFKMNDIRLFSILNIVLVFFFYCIPKSKRSVYLLPIYPFIAYFLAEYILYLRHVRPIALKIFGNIIASFSLLLLVVFIFLCLGWIPESLFSGHHAEENILYMRTLASVSMGFSAYILLGLIVVTGGFFMWICRNKSFSSWGHYSLIIHLFSLFLALDGFFAPTLLNQKSDKPIAEHIATLVPYGKIYSCYSRSNPMRLFTLNFYLGDRIVPFDAFMPTEGYLIAGPEDANSFLEENKEYQLKQIYDSKHRSCDDHKIIGLYQFKKFEQ